MPKVSQQYRDARRDQILSAARRCFLRDGFHATSMQDLFAEAGLSSGAVYRYFTSKDDMIIAIAEENMLGIVDMIRDVAARRPDRPMGAILADILEMVRAKHVQDGLGSIAVLVWSEALRSPAVAGRLSEMLARIRGYLAEVVRERQGAGDLPADVPADALAAALMSIVPGYLMQLAVLGPATVSGVPEAVRELWPRSVVSG
jgi:AcrR family transcriptional regulator